MGIVHLIREELERNYIYIYIGLVLIEEKMKRNIEACGILEEKSAAIVMNFWNLLCGTRLFGVISFQTNMWHWFNEFSKKWREKKIPFSFVCNFETSKTIFEHLILIFRDA